MTSLSLTSDQKEKILKFIQSLKTNGFTFREIVRILDLDSDARSSLRRFLDQLDSEGLIRRIKRGRYVLAAKESLVTGILNCHPDGYGFLLPDDRLRYKEDIFIPAKNMESALHGDRVLVRLSTGKETSSARCARRKGTKVTRPKLEGAVVRVLQRRYCTIVGRYHEHIRYPYVQPLDARMIHDIRIPYHAAKGAKEGQIVAVALTVPPARNQMPQGRIIDILGKPGDPNIEYKIVAHKFGLPADFSAKALEEAEALPDHVLEHEYNGREDLRAEVAVTMKLRETLTTQSALKNFPPEITSWVSTLPMYLIMFMKTQPLTWKRMNEALPYTFPTGQFPCFRRSFPAVFAASIRA